MLDQALVHQQRMRTSRDVGMNGHGEDELVVLSIEVVEVVLPAQYVKSMALCSGSPSKSTRRL